MKHLRTLLAIAFVSALASSTAFAEGDKKPEEKGKKDKSACCACCTCEKKDDKNSDCCTGKKPKADKKS